MSALGRCLGCRWRPLLAHVIACAAVLLWPAGAQARHILDLDVATQPAQLQDWGDWLVDPSGTATLRTVLARNDLLHPTPPDGQFPFRPGEVLWIRFTLPAAPDEQHWYVRIADPALDSVTLFTRRGDDTWSSQSAGDSLPVSAWALPQLHPVLPLVVSAAEPTFYLLRIQAGDGLRVPIEFVSENWLSWEEQRMTLLYGILFGLFAGGAMISLFTSAMQRDMSQFWFGVWIAMTLLATASVAGVAGLHLWPESPRWSDAAPRVLSAAAGAPFMLFVLQVLAVRERAERLFWPGVLLVIAAVGFALLCGFVPSPARRWLSEGTVAVVAAAVVGFAIWAWRHGEPLARRILAAFVPFAAALALYAVRGSLGAGFARHALVLLLVALAITIGATYLLLASRTQVRRDSHRRIAQLQEIDPLTGLVNDAVFMTRLADLIPRSRRFEHQSVAAIVEFTNFHQLRSEFGRKHSLEHLLRLAERLSAMVRTVDTVARLGETRFGLLVDGPVAPSRAKALCAKVIAHCITPMSGLPLGMVIKPRIAMALVPMHGDRAPDVIALLDRMLRMAASDPNRAILVPDGTDAGPSLPQSTQPPVSEPAATSIAAFESEFQPTSASAGEGAPDQSR